VSAHAEQGQWLKCSELRWVPGARLYQTFFVTVCRRTAFIV